MADKNKELKVTTTVSSYRSIQMTFVVRISKLKIVIVATIVILSR